MDDVVNRFARELADAIAAAGRRESASGGVPREGPRPRASKMRLTLEAVRGLREPVADRGADQGHHTHGGAGLRSRAARWR